MHITNYIEGTLVKKLYIQTKFLISTSKFWQINTEFLIV